MKKIYKILGKFYTHKFENLIGKSLGKGICMDESVKSTKMTPPPPIF